MPSPPSLAEIRAASEAGEITWDEAAREAVAMLLVALADTEAERDALRDMAARLRTDPDFTEMCEAGFPELTTFLDAVHGPWA